MARILLISCFLLAGSAAWAEVVSRSEHGFEIRHEIVVPVDPQQAYRIFVDRVRSWWSDAHTFSGNAGNLAFLDGCFCEIWDGHRVEHLRVVNAAPGKLLRLKGGLGPLQALAVTGSMDIAFRPAEHGGTHVTLGYTVAGHGLADWPDPVDGVLGEQVKGYQEHVQTQLQGQH